MREKKNIIAFLVILVLGLGLNYRYLNEFPSYIHAWAQADRYALALGFMENGFNFLEPQTFVFNHQFPDNWLIESEESITAVDFPIHDYIVAIIMKSTASSSPFVFRAYILLYSFIGLFALFRLVLLLTRSNAKSFFVIVFAATSPVFVYYQNGFLPSIPSLANILIALFFYIKYLQNGINRHFVFSVLFATLATLSRTTFAVAFCSILSVEMLRIFRNETSIKPKILPVALSLISIATFFIHNTNLRNRYGSIFLNKLLPATSFANATEIIKAVLENWVTQYFSLVHYASLIAIIGFAIFFVFKSKVSINRTTKSVALLTIIMLLGYKLFALAMMQQFPAHDYYFLDTFYIVLILVLVVSLSVIPIRETKYGSLVSTAIILMISIPMIYHVFETQMTRRQTGNWDKITITAKNFNGTDRFLDSMNISRQAKILVIDACAPNVPFIRMKRRGYALMSTKRENIINALSWDFDYIAIQNEYFLTDIFPVYPDIINQIEKIATNERVTFYALANSFQNKSLLQFLNLDGKTPVFESIMTFDSANVVGWQNIQTTEAKSFSGKKAGILTSENEFGITYKTTSLPAIQTQSRTMLFESYFCVDTMADCNLVVSINENGQNSFYKSHNLKELITETQKWQKIDLLFQLPQITNSDYEFGIYIWNTGKNNIFIDDFKFEIY